MFTVLMRVRGSSTRGNMDTSRPATAPRGPITPQTEASPRPASLVVSRMLQVIATLTNVSLTSHCSFTLTLTPYAVPQCYHINTWSVLSSVHVCMHDGHSLLTQSTMLCTHKLRHSPYCSAHTSFDTVHTVVHTQAMIQSILLCTLKV